MLHHFLRRTPRPQSLLRRRMQPPTVRLPLVMQPRPAQRGLPLRLGALPAAVDVPAVARPAHRHDPPAATARKQPVGFSSSFVDRAGTWPPAPLDFLAPLPYLARVDSLAGFAVSSDTER